MNNSKDWERLEFEGLPIYVQPERPDWVVPNAAADYLLNKWFQQEASGSLADNFHLNRLLAQMESPAEDYYKGRAQYLTIKDLKECWFHLTNKCNLSCSHCLFSSSPARRESISPATLNQALEEAGELGCRLFYFTGGEPFIYPGFMGLLSKVLQDKKSHAVILTNGLLLDKYINELAFLPSERMHLQISLDGMAKQHDALRGKGNFQKVLKILDFLRRKNIQITLSMAVNRENIESLTDMVELAASRKIFNLHLMYHFVRGKGSEEQFIPPAEIFQHLRKAYKKATGLGVVIDNFEIIRSQIFSVPGTKYDLSNAGWQSLAIGPSGAIYPSPALIGEEEANCGFVKNGLEKTWRQSKVMKDLRMTTLRGSNYEKNPLKFLIGGGDIDHSFNHNGKFAGSDPYVELYNLIALSLIKEQVEQYPISNDRPGYILKMGEARADCPEGGTVSLTHCNCVVSLVDKGGRSSIREFYAAAASAANLEIVNPFAGEQAEAHFIPTASREKSYGCGSPVLDADLAPGEVMIDLGSGSGTECFQGAEKVGPRGKVIGIDMTREMLALANTSKEKVAGKLGYHNVEFQFGYLENLPLEDNLADVIISNCVINLSPDKRQTLLEAFRVLKPGGRLVVSDIVSENPVPVEIKNDHKFRGECLGGAFTQEELMGMLSSAGFSRIKLIKRFPYRKIKDTQFFSLTFSALKPAQEKEVEVIYRGPYAAVTTENGQTLFRGKRIKIRDDDEAGLDDSLFILDSQGKVVNLEQGTSCCSISPLESSCCSSSSENQKECCQAESTSLQKEGDCLICGQALIYAQNEEKMTCHNCGGGHLNRVSCKNGHYICDDCHQEPALAVIRKICTTTKEKDMLKLLDVIRRKPEINLHGPEHHALVPGIILASYRNLGGEISRDDILNAIYQGSKIPGGTCGFWGTCGTAVGVGIGFSAILAASPLQGKSRQQAMKASSQVLARQSEIAAPRCCQRETWLALKEAARLSEELLPLALKADSPLRCNQFEANRECVRRLCPLWESRSSTTGRVDILPLAGPAS